MSECCEILPWDSEFFGIRIARVTSDRLTGGVGDAVIEWADSHGVSCLYFLADPADALTMRVAPEYGFDLVDVRVTLDAATNELPEVAATRKVRAAKPGDIAALEAIARASHHDSRFYADGRFNRDRCDALYATWIANSCRGGADLVLVADVKRQPAGYITGHIRDDRSASIGLAAVAAPAQGRGLGRALVTSALAAFRERGARRVSVVTQGRNQGALRLYQQCGFELARLQLWYHRWLDSERVQ